MASKTQVKNFIERIAPIAIQTCNKKARKILPSVCIAQACQESGYGTTERMIKANAVFGIKVGSKQIHYGTAWKGKAYSTKTHEFYDGKTNTTITALFRAYDTLEEAVEDYYDLLGNNSRFTGTVGETDYEKCIDVIVKGGYATAPNYKKGLVSIITKYNLTQYDTCVTGWEDRADMIAADKPTLKYKVGDFINVSSYYKASTSKLELAIIKNASGTIIKIKEGARNPYCFGIGNSPIGWCNDGDVRSVGSIPAGIIYHKVKLGDSLSKIAKANDTNVDAIVKLNKEEYPTITPSFIKIGWNLRVK